MATAVQGPLCLVIGANGRLGRAVTEALLARGRRVRVAVRNPATVADLVAKGAEPATIDLTHAPSFVHALSGADIIITAAHSLTGRARGAIARIDIDGHQRLIDAASRIGLTRFIYLSAMGASRDHPSAFWRAKASVEDHLAASGIAQTILRPSAFMELYVHDLIGRAVLAGKPVRLLGAGDLRRNYIAVDDVVAAVTATIDTDDAAHAPVEIGGPDNATDSEIAALYAELSGRPAKISAVPDALLTPIASLIAPFHAGLANIVRLPRELRGSPGLMNNGEQLAALIGRRPISLRDFIAGRVARHRTQKNRQADA